MPASDLDLSVLTPSQFDRVVAAEANGDGTATLYQRVADDKVTARSVPFRPWLLVASYDVASSIPHGCELRRLQGPGIFNVQVLFDNEAAYRDGLAFLKESTGCTLTAARAPYRVSNDLGQQLLTQLPARLFRGMIFSDIRRMQIDIETFTSPGYDFPNAERAEDAIIIIAMRDSTGWEACLSGPGLDEAGMLREMVRLVQERDPDVIEGHNLFNFDLPYITARARRCRLPLKLGRDGSAMTGRASRFTAGERTSNYTRFDIHGRHIVDTLQLVQLYDVSHRDLESFGLKAVARHFGVAAPERTYVQAETISATFRENPKKVRDYAMDDVRETEALARLLSPSYFCQAQLVPFSFQNCITRGNAARIDALLVAGYMEKGAAIPRPGEARAFRGGLTEAVKSGVFHNVWHVDVASLYPSIILSFGMVPKADSLKLYPAMLAELRRFRLAAKDAARSAKSPGEREHYAALQSSFKVLINSFYGYVGFGQGTFNDFDMAEAVTAKGREILTRMLEFLEKEKANVIEMDTDGIYFVPPQGVNKPGALLERLQAQFPTGIDVDLDATYIAMFSYKSKNYALIDADGRVSVTGAALKSRGLEPFQRRYIHELVTLLLTARAGEAAGLLRRYEDAIRKHEFPLADFAQREVLSTSPAVYREKLDAGDTRRSAAYELALASGREYQQGDTVAFYLAGEKKNIAVTDGAKLLAAAKPDQRDENIAYYLDKLAKLHAKFAEFLPADDGLRLT